LHTACAQAARWAAQSVAVPQMAVNVSARQLAQPELADLVSKVLRSTGLPASSLMVEITETTLIEEGALVRRTLTALKALGVTIALDDFGTGYSSLSFLRRYPVDIVKIDQSFVAGLGRSPEDTAIVTAIIRMASSLGLRTVAEGVETAAQAA